MSELEEVVTAVIGADPKDSRASERDTRTQALLDRVTQDLADMQAEVGEAEALPTCGSCMSGPFVKRDEWRDPDLAPWHALPEVGEPGKTVTAELTVTVTRHWVQIRPTIFEGTSEEAEAAGWEQDEYERWTCKACAEKAAAHEGGAHKEDENATLHLFKEFQGVDGLRDVAATLIGRSESEGRPLVPNGLLDLMTDHQTQTEAAK